MCATDGSETLEGKIIYIGSDHMPSGREHYSLSYLKDHPEILDEEKKRMERKISEKVIDKTDRKYYNLIKKIKHL